MTNDNLPTVSRRGFLVSTSVAAAVEGLPWSEKLIRTKRKQRNHERDCTCLIQKNHFTSISLCG